MEYGDHIEMFKGIRKNGEETPLDHIPEMDFSHNWFMNAYGVLSNSSNDNGGIPLSELKIFENEFGLIGSFKEFSDIIYAISGAYAKRKSEENEKEINRTG